MIQALPMRLKASVEKILSGMRDSATGKCAVLEANVIKKERMKEEDLKFGGKNLEIGYPKNIENI